MARLVMHSHSLLILVLIFEILRQPVYYLLGLLDSARAPKIV
jgi:hypothetical protein